MAYIGQSRSQRSQEAINNGLVIKSQLSAWQKRAVEQGAVEACEWHHTGKYYSETDYYNLNDFESLNKNDFPPIKKEKKVISEKWHVLVSADWGGTKRYPRIIGATVSVKKNITDSQKYANKYSDYGGYIKEFDTEQEAIKFAKIAQLED